MARQTESGVAGLSSSLEDYLEQVYRLQNIHSYASCSEIGVLMGVNRTSVTGAMRSLSQLGLVNYKPYGKVTLTEKGRRIAEGVSTRHETLREFLGRLLLLPAADADSIACGMEHAFTQEAASRLNDFMSYIAPRMPTGWEKAFSRLLDARRNPLPRKSAGKPPAKRKRSAKEIAAPC